MNKYVEQITFWKGYVNRYRTGPQMPSLPKCIVKYTITSKNDEGKIILSR